MCGRYVLSTEEENIEIREILNEINERFKDTEELSKMKTGEMFPTNIVPVIIADSNNNKVINLFKWGFPNFKNNAVIINARSEAIVEKPTFRKSFISKRCIVPASAYFEWLNEDKKKIKHKIFTDDKNLFYMAGIYNNFVNKEGKPYSAMTIITTEANQDISFIHNRMPVILPEDKLNEWLDERNSDLPSLQNLLLPYSLGKLCYNVV